MSRSDRPLSAHCNAHEGAQQSGETHADTVPCQDRQGGHRITVRLLYDACYATGHPPVVKFVEPYRPVRPLALLAAKEARPHGRTYPRE